MHSTRRGATLVCLFASACAPRTIYPPSHGVGCGNVKEQSATDAITLPYSLQHSRMQAICHTHTQTHTLINAPLPSPVWRVMLVGRVLGVENKPVVNNSCECQKCESRDSLTFCGPHTCVFTQLSAHYRDEL